MACIPDISFVPSRHSAASINDGQCCDKATCNHAGHLDIIDAAAIHWSTLTESVASWNKGKILNILPELAATLHLTMLTGNNRNAFILQVMLTSMAGAVWQAQHVPGSEETYIQ